MARDLWESSNSVREMFTHAGRVCSRDMAELLFDADEAELGLGKVAQPVRVAVSGSTVSPPIFDTLAILGRDATLARIDRCLAHHQATA